MAWLRGAVPSAGEPPDLTASGGHVDGGGAVERSEAVAGRDAGDVAGDADHRRGHEGADAEDIDGGGAA
jgi:hypothetical protein